MLFQGIWNLVALFLRSVCSEQEFTGTTFGHDLRTREPRELTEAIRAVHDRVTTRLRIAQHEVTICTTKQRITKNQFLKKNVSNITYTLIHYVDKN